jgi:hypothetical protein
VTHNAALFIDGVVILAYFVVIVGIGLYAGRKNDTLQEFALGGHKIPGGRSSPRSSPPKQAPRLFSARRPKATRRWALPMRNWRSEPFLPASSLPTSLSLPISNSRSRAFMNTFTVRFGPRTKNMASGIFLLGRVLGIGVRLYLGGVILVVIWRYLFPDRQLRCRPTSGASFL